MAYCLLEDMVGLPNDACARPAGSGALRTGGIPAASPAAAAMAYFLLADMTGLAFLLLPASASSSLSARNLFPLHPRIVERSIVGGD
jgi:hypothetical protein